MCEPTRTWLKSCCVRPENRQQDSASPALGINSQSAGATRIFVRKDEMLAQEWKCEQTFVFDRAAANWVLDLGRQITNQPGTDTTVRRGNRAKTCVPARFSNFPAGQPVDFSLRLYQSQTPRMSASDSAPSVRHLDETFLLRSRKCNKRHLHINQKNPREHFLSDSHFSLPFSLARGVLQKDEHYFYVKAEGFFFFFFCMRSALSNWSSIMQTNNTKW